MILLSASYQICQEHRCIGMIRTIIIIIIINSSNAGELTSFCFQLRVTLPYYADTAPSAAHLVEFKISTHIAGLDPNWSDLNRSEKLNCPLQWSFFNSCFFKILKFSGHLYRAWHNPPTQFTPTSSPDPFLVWKFILTDDDFHVFCVGVRVHHLTETPEPRTTE